MTLLETVVRALADMVVSVDLSDEESVNADFAARIFDDLAGVFDTIEDEDRHQLSAIIENYAQTVSDARRRDALAGLPESIGLADEDEE
jgi:hypothetical protein